jgi:2-dehydropantoate 2-reductase
VDRISVLGPGGVGGFLAAALAHSGRAVTVVARPETATHIRELGLDVQSVRLGSFTARPEAAESLEEPTDVLLIATKATGLQDALERIRTDPQLVVPLLNGLDHMQVLRERWDPARVAAGAIRIESDRPAPGRIVQTSPFLRVELASDDPRPREAIEQLSATLEQAEIPTRIGPSEAQILWEKLVRLNALACTTSAVDRPIGFIRDDPQWRAALVGCLAEGAAVARAEGARVDAEAILADLEEAHAELGSSMQRDIATGREPELDAIAGAVLRAAARHDIDCPTVARLSELIAQRAGVAAPPGRR